MSPDFNRRQAIFKTLRLPRRPAMATPRNDIIIIFIHFYVHCKRKKEAEEPKEEAFDVSSMLGTYEEKPIMIVDDMAEPAKGSSQGGSPSSGCYASTLSHAGNAP